MTITVSRDEVCDKECLGCTNGDSRICRRWAFLLDNADARLKLPLVDGRKCPGCGHVIALDSFKFCPYCGQAFDRRSG